MLALSLGLGSSTCTLFTEAIRHQSDLAIHLSVIVKVPSHREGTHTQASPVL